MKAMMETKRVVGESCWTRGERVSMEGVASDEMVVAIAEVMKAPPRERHSVPAGRVAVRPSMAMAVMTASAMTMAVVTVSPMRMASVPVPVTMATVTMTTTGGD